MLCIPLSFLPQPCSQNVGDMSGLNEIRRITGVCPQHDVLFDDLTCEEHLLFYGAIKGVTRQNLDQLVSAYLCPCTLCSAFALLSHLLTSIQIYTRHVFCKSLPSA